MIESIRAFMNHPVTKVEYLLLLCIHVCVVMPTLGLILWYIFERKRK